MEKKILVFLPTNPAAYPFSQANAFSELQKHFDVYLVYNKRAVFIDDVRTEGFTRVMAWDQPIKRKRSWMMFLNMWGHRRATKSFGDSFKRIFQMDMEQRNWLYRFLFFYLPGFSYRWTSFLLQFIEQWMGEDKTLAKLVDEIKPNLIIGMLCGYSAYDIDPIKIAQKRKIPTLYLQVGWDNIPHRGLLPYKMDYLGAWGYQSAMFAELIQGIPKRRIFLMGCPFGEVLREPPKRPSEEIRRTLQLPLGKKVLFFAGVSHVGNEVGLLDLLEKFIEEGKLPNCCVLYRPHPYRQFTKNEPNFFERHYKHIYLDPQMKERFRRHIEEKAYMTGHQERLERSYAYNREILSISSILIAPISTFVAEALYCGVPSVVVSFVGKDHAKYSIRYDMATNQFYHAVPGVFNSFSPSDLLAKCRQALSFSENEHRAHIIRSHLNSIAYQDEFSFAQRIDYAVQSILNTNGQSLYHYLHDPLIDVEKKENVVESYLS